MATVSTISWVKGCMNHFAPYWYCWAGTRYASEVRKDPCAMCLLVVSTKFSFCAACSSWVHKRCIVIFGTLRPYPIFRGKQCTGLVRPVDNQWYRSQWEGRTLRWCHLSATLRTAYLRVSAANLTPSQYAVLHGTNSMSPCPSAHPHHLLISHYDQRNWGIFYISMQVKPGPHPRLICIFCNATTGLLSAVCAVTLLRNKSVHKISWTGCNSTIWRRYPSPIDWDGITLSNVVIICWRFKFRNSIPQEAVTVVVLRKSGQKWSIWTV